MTEYKFCYNNTEILYTIDMLGNEKVFVANELIAKDRRWFKSVTRFEFTINGEPVSITSRILSYDDAQNQVMLANQTKIIDKQLKPIINWNENGNQTAFGSDELDWLNEVKLPESVFNFAWISYLLFVVQIIAISIFNAKTISTLFAWISVAVVAGAIVLFFWWGFKEIFRNTNSIKNKS